MKTRTFIGRRLAVDARTIATTRHPIFLGACLWIGLLAFTMMAFGPQPAQAALTEAWVQRYGSGPAAYRSLDKSEHFGDWPEWLGTVSRQPIALSR